MEVSVCGGEMGVRGCDKKPGRDDGIDDEKRRLEGPHMKKKKKHGGGTGTGRIMKREARA